MSRDCEDLWSSIQFLYSQNKKLFEMYLMQCAHLAAAEAHCTLASHQISMLNEQLANKTQKKHWKSKKLNARFVTHPELKEAFAAEQAERTEKEKVEAEKAAQKKADNDARLSRIEEDIKTKIFDGSLASYKRKDDLITIAGALSLPRDGTITELTARIKEYLAANPDCANQQRFSALLGGKRNNTVAAAVSTSVQPSSVPQRLGVATSSQSSIFFVASQQNLQPSSSTSSSSHPGHPPSLVFTHPSHPSYISGQWPAPSHNSLMYQYPHPYFTQQYPP
jgi:hypothetical protein